MVKKSIILVVNIFILISFWFFFIRSFDVRFKFKVKSLPEIVLETLRVWVLTNEESVLSSIDREKFRLVQSVNKDNEEFFILWEIYQQKDSTIQVIASINGNSSENRFYSLFSSSSFFKICSTIIYDFHTVLINHLKSIKIDVVGVHNLEEKICLCVLNNTTQFGKAGGMMNTYMDLSNFISYNSIDISGSPIINVIEWNEKNDKLDFDFCFPILNKINFNHPKYYLKKIEKGIFLKATYNGNYITSDRAWYALINFANKNKLNIIRKPIEIFFK